MASSEQGLLSDEFHVSKKKKFHHSKAPNLSKDLTFFDLLIKKNWKQILSHNDSGMRNSGWEQKQFCP